jgi:hypothetical protein
MPTPAELRKISEAGKQKKQEKEAEERKKADVKAREAAREKALKLEAEAQRIIINVSSQLKWAADDGLFSARVYSVPTDELGCNVYTKKLHGKDQNDYNLSGIAKRVFDHFKKEGFEVLIEEQDGPYDPEGPTPSTYHIRVGW